MTAVTERTVDGSGMEAATEVAIEVEGLSAGYAREPVIRDLWLSVPRGTVYGLLGPSGSGKTTLLRVLATLHPASSGSIRLDGIDSLRNLRKVRGRIGYVPERGGYYGDLTVREYLDFYASLFGVPARRRRQWGEELLELFRLSDSRDRPVERLSRGARQRLAIARALVHDPAILLLDEPTAGLDPISRLELREILVELARLGKTVLLASNLVSELEGICTHAGIMLRGRLVAGGDVTDLVSGDESLEGVFLRETVEGSEG
jgi:ABC-2 type transport system ATP-binding protein